MSSSFALKLLEAVPGPRIRARRKSGFPPLRTLSESAPRTPADLGLNDWRVLVRGSLVPHPATLLDWLSLREFSSTRRRARQRLQEIDARLSAGAALPRIAAALHEALALDPSRDGVRLLLACLHIETRQPVSALVQLAPLRDRNPDQGEIVLLAACAYAQLGYPRECQLMLDILHAPANHPVASAIRALQSSVRAALGIERDYGPPPGDPLATKSS